MKKLLFGGIALITGLVVIPNVSAESPSSIDKWDDLKTCLSSENATCTLAGSVEAEEQIEINKNITIDLNGNTLSIKNAKMGNHTAFILVKKGDLTIKDSKGNGKVTTDKGFAIGAAGDTAKTITIGKGVTIETTDKTATLDSAINLDTALNTTLNVSGTVKAPGFAINVNGQQKTVEGCPVININSGAKIESTDGAGMYLAGYANTTVNNATISGKVGIGIKSGILTLNGATVMANGDFAEPEPYTNGLNLTGSAIQVESQTDAYAGDIEITVNGGTISSEKNSAIEEYGAEEGTTTQVKDIEIKGNATLHSAANKPVITGSESFNETNIGFIAAGTKLDGKVSDMGTYLATGTEIDENGKVIDPNAPTTTANAAKKDDVPKTGNGLPMALIGIMALVSVIGAFNLKLAFNRK